MPQDLLAGKRQHEIHHAVITEGRHQIDPGTGRETPESDKRRRAHGRGEFGRVEFGGGLRDRAVA